MNLSVFPLGPVAYPPDAEAPGCAAPWGGPYAVAAPAGGLLPFHWARPHSATRRLDCADVIDAETEAVVQALVVDPATPGAPLYLPVELYYDAASNTDYLLYYGDLIDGLALPCGRRLRLRLDNEVVSPVFVVYEDLSAAPVLEWWHDTPLGSVPYGTGLHQRLYMPGATVWHGEPKEYSETSKDAFGRDVLDFRAVASTATFTTPPLPAWLREALSGIRSHAHVTLSDFPETRGERVALSYDAADRCRSSVTVTVEALEVVTTAAGTCAAPAPLVAVPVPEDGYAVRGWRCGDTSDTAEDWQDTGLTRCEQDTTATWQDTGRTRCAQDSFSGGSEE
ncbi:hypothetical protein LJ737_20705 [Hymenobacter sp. 15J16-1T3B]|uniref:hypothetical protein n=1 Tax=Hymenobacter sp. 15J16-1T3B TaxID=2886941 RepID=UPI001D10C9CA|nr:hypothetical protein [Hymenobacter sp. 15J16-1T3B]MCC3159674.1 hypothetical protein [Hymenobacter sp. 15J16-1T3B]